MFYLNEGSSAKCNAQVCTHRGKKLGGLIFGSWGEKVQDQALAARNHDEDDIIVQETVPRHSVFTEGCIRYSLSLSFGSNYWNNHPRTISRPGPGVWWRRTASCNLDGGQSCGPGLSRWQQYPQSNSGPLDLAGAGGKEKFYFTRQHEFV